MSLMGQQTPRVGVPPATGMVATLRGRLSGAFAADNPYSVAQRMAGAAFLIRVASAAIAYVSQVAMARWMGGHEFGVYVYVWVWVLLIGHLSNLGLASAAQRFLPAYAETKDLAGYRGFLRGARVMGLVQGTTMMVIGLLLLWRFGHLVSSLTLIPLVLACLCLPLYVLTDIQDGIARANNWTDLALGPPYLVRPILILLAMAGAHFAGFPDTATTAMAAAVFATWTASIVQYVLLRRRLLARMESGPRRVEPMAWLVVSLPIFLVEGFYFALTYVDIILLKQFRSTEEVAIYWAAVKTLALVAFISFSVGAASAHQFSAYHASGDREKLSELLARTIRWTFFPSLAATALVLAMGVPFLSLFGPNFIAGYPAMFIMAIGLLARASVGPMERLLAMSGHQRMCAAVYAVVFTVAVGLGVLLIPAHGMIGAATATAAALVVESLLLMIVTKRRLGLSVSLRGGAKARSAQR